MRESTSGPLHGKSHWSLGLGVDSPAQLAAAAARQGHGLLALTDVETLAGQVEHHRHARRAGLHAITGVELRQRFARDFPGSRRGRLVLLARDEAGWQTLCRIVTARRLGPPAPPIESVTAGSRGLVVLSDDPGAIAPLLARGTVARADCALLLVRPSPSVPPARVLAAAARLRIPLVADADVVWIEPADCALHALRAAVHEHRRRPLGVEPGDRRLRSPTELRELFADRPDALATAGRIAAECTLDLTRRPRVVPMPPGIEPAQAGAVLRAFVAATPPESPQHAARLESELRQIETLGFAGYFLVVADLLRIARARGISCAGRGSVGGSLVAYRLGLTSADPLAEGLLFERFLHELREEPPDIDLDVASDRRDELLAALFRRYGRERCALVAAHHRFQRRSAWRAGLQALGEAPHRIRARLAALPPPELALEPPPPPPGSALALADRLVGMPHHVAAHPGGVLLADRPLVELLPLERTPQRRIVTQFDLRSVEQLGLVKLDLLGNRSLGEFATAARLLAARGVRVDPLAAPIDDAATLATIRHAATVGCFQLESPAMRGLLAQLPLRAFGDVVDALALVRPGAAAGDAKQSYLRRAAGAPDGAPAHPIVTPILAATHGVLLYDEDWLRILHAATGLPLAQADRWRVAVQRVGGDAAQLAQLARRFGELARQQGLDASGAGAIWSLLARFAAYTFAKAHALAYARLGFVAAWWKTHHPAEFGCALLDQHGGSYPLRTIAAEIARRTPLLLPDVERSAATCTPAPDARGAPAIRLGLANVLRLSDRSRRRLLAERDAHGPFGTLAGLLRRVRLRTPELEALVWSGACDALPPLDRDAYPARHERLLALLRPVPAAHRASAWPDALAAAAATTLAGEPALLDRYRRLVRVQHETRQLAMHVTDHPIRLLRDAATRLGCVPTDALPADGSHVRVAAILAAARRAQGSDGRVVQFLTLEDERGLLEAVLFPDVERRFGALVTTPGPYLVHGRVRRVARLATLEVQRLERWPSGAPATR